jgi:hypothetical protein
LIRNDAVSVRAGGLATKRGCTWPTIPGGEFFGLLAWEPGKVLPVPYAIFRAIPITPVAPFICSVNGGLNGFIAYCPIAATLSTDNSSIAGSLRS